MEPKLKKRASIVALIGVVAIAAGSAAPAKAAGPYRIQAGYGSAFGLGYNAMKNANTNCSAVAASAINGVDARIVDVGAWAGRNVHIDWDAEQNLGGIETHPFTASCELLFKPGTTSMTNPGRLTIGLPTGTKWLVVTANYAVNVSFHVTLAV